ncbi:MAG: hypothetical protein Tsb0013_13280 [Phycisphaerales bacterium]
MTESEVQVGVVAYFDRRLYLEQDIDIPDEIGDIGETTRPFLCSVVSDQHAEWLALTSQQGKLYSRCEITGCWADGNDPVDDPCYISDARKALQGPIAAFVRVAEQSEIPFKCGRPRLNSEGIRRMQAELAKWSGESETAA